MTRPDQDLVVSDIMGGVPSWDFVRGPAGVRMLVAAGTSRGMTAAQCLASTALAEAALADPATRVEAGQELQVARNLIATLGDPPGLGADAGARLTLGTFGVWTFALATSPTLNDALALALRFWQLSSSFLRAAFDGGGPVLRLVLHDDEIPADVRDLLAERDLAAILAFIPQLVGAIEPLELRIHTRLPADRARALGAVNRVATVTPGAPQHALEFDAAALARALPQADPVTRRACEQECARLLDARRRRTGTAALVRAKLLEDPAAMPSLAELAAQMSFDVRTLRRHLTAEGTSYRALRQEVVQTLALELLQTVGLSVGEVAARVGYADPTAFSHAFSRWHGRPPSAVRA